ncbi:hypothetical protein EYF80_007095 [Liparis tanakae]|uniref:Uncharacterized protein n=1 Tax=Liparis tanakae TaxID=230148 RepID=A0A4Z2IXS0_9TELE|nr:hypothetical protein EYF80_007095 [Liparis tanakae]
MTFARTDLNFSCNKPSSIKSITKPSLGNSFTGRGGMLTGVAGYMLPVVQFSKKLIEIILHSNMNKVTRNSSNY